MRDAHIENITMVGNPDALVLSVLFLPILVLKSSIQPLKPLSVSVTFICHLESIPVPPSGVRWSCLLGPRDRSEMPY